MADTIILRSEARRQGLSRYFTGKPCKRGHVAERYVRNLTCVDCDREKQKAAQWHVKNRERHNELGRQSNERCKDRRGEYNRSYHAANRDRIRAKWFATPVEARRERRKKWEAKNADKLRTYLAEWQKQNMERVREYRRASRLKRRVQTLGSPGRHTAADLVAILQAQDHRCAYCRADLRKVEKHLDHIVPLAKGGSDDRTNLQYTCGYCNRTKSAKDPLAFARERGLLL